MYYEINISQNGRHLFATAERSIEFYWELKRVYDVLKKKFPEEEGYKITVTKWSKTGREIDDVEKYIEDQYK